MKLNSIDRIRLWLDDERNPTHYSIKSMFGSKGDEIWVKTAKDAIEYLDNGNVIYISLDHDLGPPEAGTGYDVASWIEEAAYFNKIPKLAWRVHSKNNVGVDNMVRALQAADKFWAKTNIL